MKTCRFDDAKDSFEFCNFEQILEEEMFVKIKDVMLKNEKIFHLEKIPSVQNPFLIVCKGSYNGQEYELIGDELLGPIIKCSNGETLDKLEKEFNKL
jgi:hypothetical protein